MGGDLRPTKETLRISDETWRLIRDSQTVERCGVTRWAPPDYDHYHNLLPDELTDRERALWEGAEGRAKKYAAMQIRDWREIKETGEYEPHETLDD